MENNGEESPAIGIDLGTTNSVVGVWRPVLNRVEIFENEAGSHTTPSMVAFTPILRFIGQPAKNHAVINPSNTVFESKRLIGRRFNDATVQEDIKLWPYKVVPGKDDRPMIEVTEEEKVRKFSAEEISSMIIQKMKGIAEEKLGTQVKNAVITVPAYFNDSQRQATKDAGEIAGLNVLRIITEPTAAAMAYCLHKKMKAEDGKKNLLVFDLGGGTLDVSLVNISKDTFDVKAVTGDTHLGGGDFDNRMVSHFVVEFRRKHNRDIHKNPKALAKLRVACEKAKRALSSAADTTIEIDSLFEGIDFISTITRARFENINADLFKKCMEQVDKCLKDAQMEKSDIHDVVLVGGSTRIPKIQTLLKDLFNGKELSKCINPDEAVAYGAAYQGALLSGVDKDNNKDVLIRDVIPLSLGIKVKPDGKMHVVVPRNTTYPTRMRSRVYTSEDNQTAVGFPVYEGEQPYVKDNYLLGSFSLYDIPPRPEGEEKFEVYFDIDSNGILTVSAQHIGTKNRKEITITNHSGRLSTEELNRIKTEAMEYFTKLEKKRIALLAKNTFEDYVFSIMGCLTDYVMIGTEKGKLQLAIDRAIQWLDDSSALAEAWEFEEKLSELQSIFEPIVKLQTSASSRW